MTKLIVWALILGSLAVSLFVGIGYMNRDAGRLIGFAVAPADENGQSELQIVVNPLVLMQCDPPPYKPDVYKPDYASFMNTHFEVDAGNGPLNNWRQGGFKTRQISEAQAGAADFIGLCHVPAGTPITITYHPQKAEPEKYVMKLDGSPQEFKRRTFEPAY